MTHSIACNRAQSGCIIRGVMRHLVMTFVALILTAPVADAQSRRGGNQPPPPPPTMPALPPSVAPPITYPFAPLLPPPPGGLTPRFGEGPPFRTRDRRFFQSGSAVFPPYGFGYQEPEPFSRQQARPPAPATGLLRFSVTPASAQVFVDSYYVGTVADVDAQRVLELEAGPHRIEFRAPQYQALTVDVRILPHETITYRGALEPTRPVAAAAAVAPPTVMYVIPKCYLGNLPPRQSRLPAGCDIKQVEVLRPAAVASQR
jgi:hypothetical protein